MFKGLGAMGDMAKMMKTAKDMQTRMTDLQEEMNDMTVTGEAGAGLVKATANAKGKVKSLYIDHSIFSAEDKEVVEDLILAAISNAQDKAQEKAAEEMQKLAAEMGLPADMKLPF